MQIVNNMRGRFVVSVRGREAVIRGNLTTCNFGPDESGHHCYNGPFTDVTITRFSGTSVRMPASSIISFEVQ